MAHAGMKACFFCECEKYKRKVSMAEPLGIDPPMLSDYLGEVVTDAKMSGQNFQITLDSGAQILLPDDPGKDIKGKTYTNVLVGETNLTLVFSETYTQDGYSLLKNTVEIETRRGDYKIKPVGGGVVTPKPPEKLPSGAELDINDPPEEAQELG